MGIYTHLKDKQPQITDAKLPNETSQNKASEVQIPESTVEK